MSLGASVFAFQANVKQQPYTSGPAVLLRRAIHCPVCASYRVLLRDRSVPLRQSLLLVSLRDVDVVCRRVTRIGTLFFVQLFFTSR